jgi:tetratricopeptide (TPR) repeat protein
VATLDHWAQVKVFDPKTAPRLLEIARLADPDPWRDRVRQVTIPPNVLDQLAEQVRPEQQSPHILLLLTGHGRFGLTPRGEQLIYEALTYYPTDFWLHYTLTTRPRNPQDRIIHYWAALAIRPQAWQLHRKFGFQLMSMGEVNRALFHYQRALDIHPAASGLHLSIGDALKGLKDWDGAERHYRKLVEMQPDSPAGYSRLAAVLERKGDWDGAIRHHRRMLTIDPQDAGNHANLGRVLLMKGEVEEAVTHLREATRLNSNMGSYFAMLGDGFRRQHKFTEAVTAYQKAFDLSSKTHSGKPNPVKPGLEQCKLLAEVEQRLPGVLAGTLVPEDAKEYLRLADFCLSHRMLPRTATRFYTTAFAADPGLAARPQWYLTLPGPNLETRKKTHRYCAVRAAVMAAFGQESVEPRPPEADQIKLRLQALSWFKEEFQYVKTSLQDKESKQIKLFLEQVELWRTDRALAPVREPDALAKLPPGEQKAWQALWTEIELTVKPRQNLTEETTRIIDLGRAELKANHPDKAIGLLEKATEMQPDNGIAFYHLGFAFQRKGMYTSAASAFQKALDLTGDRGGIERVLDECKARAELEQKLSQVLAGKLVPKDAEENIRLADFCLSRAGRPGTAARFYATAFAARPALATAPDWYLSTLRTAKEPSMRTHRYCAVQAAVRAIEGKYGDEPRMTEPEQARLRQQALAWLSDEFQWVTSGWKLAKPNEKKPWVTRLQYWKGDIALSSVRDQDALARLPQGERHAWEALWRQVDEFIKTNRFVP